MVMRSRVPRPMYTSLLCQNLEAAPVRDDLWQDEQGKTQWHEHDSGRESRSSARAEPPAFAQCSEHKADERRQIDEEVAASGERLGWLVHRPHQEPRDGRHIPPALEWRK